MRHESHQKTTGETDKRSAIPTLRTDHLMQRALQKPRRRKQPVQGYSPQRQSRGRSFNRGIP